MKYKVPKYSLCLTYYRNNQYINDNCGVSMIIFNLLAMFLASVYYLFISNEPFKPKMHCIPMGVISSEAARKSILVISIKPFDLFIFT